MRLFKIHYIKKVLDLQLEWITFMKFESEMKDDALKRTNKSGVWPIQKSRELTFRVQYFKISPSSGVNFLFLEHKELSREIL